MPTLATRTAGLVEQLMPKFRAFRRLLDGPDTWVLRVAAAVVLVRAIDAVLVLQEPSCVIGVLIANSLLLDRQGCATARQWCTCSEMR